MKKCKQVFSLFKGRGIRYISSALICLIISILPFSLFAEEQVYFYHNDHLGSPVAVTDASGSEVWKADYEPFGTVTTTATAVSNTHQFTGKEADSETGLYYFGARYYDPGIGRFLSRDTFSLSTSPTMILKYPQRLNLYAYVENNPMNRIDPLGLWSLSIEAYRGFGGGIVFGENPKGGPFVTFRVGYGIGGGISYDPYGSSPGWEPSKEHGILNVGLGVYGEAGVAFGPLSGGVGGSAGLNAENFGSPRVFDIGNMGIVGGFNATSIGGFDPYFEPEPYFNLDFSNAELTIPFDAENFGGFDPYLDLDLNYSLELDWDYKLRFGGGYYYGGELTFY